MDNIVTSHISSSSPLYKQVYELREQILRVPLGRSLKNEDLSRDHEDDIVIAQHDGKVIGCVLVHPLHNGQAQLRAMAVYDQWQGRGIGRMLVLAAEDICVRKGWYNIILHARKVALGFYLNLGYSVTSDEFTEVGIPHFMMAKSINNNP